MSDFHEQLETGKRTTTLDRHSEATRVLVYVSTSGAVFET